MQARLIAALLLIVPGSSDAQRFAPASWMSFMPARTVAEVVDQYGPSARGRLSHRFRIAGLNYPPNEIALLAFKAEQQLELWARVDGGWVQIHRYPIQAASGHAGPKLREGDRQVPEGRYRIIGLNPNSAYHLSMKLDYPNAFDRQWADAEGRSEPGSDIFIHGKAVSVGCLAMGDSAIEELFVLVADVGRAQAEVLIAPHDPKLRRLLPVPAGLPTWSETLYRELEQSLARFPR